MMNCKKCGSAGTVTLRSKDFYCDNCFITNINHKFRACIGKNRAITPHENVLVCLSGGISSTVLLDMVYNGISLSNHKKLRIIPVFLHLKDSSNTEDSELLASHVINQCKNYNFKVYVIHTSEYIKKDTTLLDVNYIPADTNVEEYQAMLSSLPASIKIDFTAKLKRHLYIRIAEKLHCKYIFTAESTATLAISLLSNLTVGRGAQVQDDVSFCDARNLKVKILRPMKDITLEELQYYVKIKKLDPIDKQNVDRSSLQSVIGKFVTELQDSFQATISTVCKTADKIGSHNEDNMSRQCIFCETKLGIKNTKLTALDATNFSRLVSLKRSDMGSFSFDVLQNLSDELVSKPMFPFIDEHLCYGCSRNYLEMNQSNLPVHIREALQSQVN